jgi:hypothetical protein
MAKDTFYFSHDYNAQTDEKIKLLLRKHGMLGYGVFWSIIEGLYNNANALRTDYDGIAYDLRTDAEIIKSIINDFDLFVFEDGFFGSKSVEARLEERNEKSKKAQKSAFKRWNKCERIANALKNDAIASEIDAIKKGKDIKESKERKKTYAETSNEVLLSVKLYEEILKINPEHKKPSFQNWAKEVDLMIRIDHRTESQISEMILFATKNNFWCKNILSTKSLREKFDRLLIEKKKGNGNGKSTGAQPDELAAIVARRFNRENGEQQT